MRHTGLNMILAVLALAFLACACSTTRRIPDGEVLYTGVKKFRVETRDPGQKLPPDMVSQVKEAGNVPPNNPMPFMSPYMRTPFPIGLWVYNNMSDSAGGLKGWIYRKLAKDPVLISSVKPDLRAKMMESILDNNGYFGSSASYTLTPDKKNPKKARVNYEVEVGEPYLIDSLIYFRTGDRSIFHYIDSLALRDLISRPDNASPPTPWPWHAHASPTRCATVVSTISGRNTSNFSPTAP